ncbi:MAG: hypothetical protein Q7S34_00670 [bacterium]|nr:hypothetical protein [bacterium]
MKRLNEHKVDGGSMLVQILVFAGIAMLLITALIGWAATNVLASRQAFYREQAFQIAEAGIEYYRWHIAHAPNDYQDGTGVVGPYVHDFTDKEGNIIGTFTLDIVPPPIGSTVVVVRSKGVVNAYPSVYRRIEVKFAKPSFAKYAAVSNAGIGYGQGDEVFGPIHSNNFVKFFNGNPRPVAHNLVTSALANYKSGSTNYYGVFTLVSPADPTAQSPSTPPLPPPSRPDVFMAGRQFPVPVVDFAGITNDLSLLQTEAQTSGFYRGSSGANGYKIVLNTNNTFDIYTVNTLLAPPSAGGQDKCVKDVTEPNGENNWGSWSIDASVGATTLIGNFAIPADGILFFEDHVWVEGQINNTRVTIIAGTLPDNSATRKNIIVNNNLLYTNFDGQDAIGLIAQGDFLIGLASANNLTIDAAIIAQNGATFRYYYRPPSGGRNYCGPYHTRASLTTYGMFATYLQAYFLQVQPHGNSGYLSQPATYDANLLYAPPPLFPLTSDQYQTLYWQEIK